MAARGRKIVLGVLAGLAAVAGLTWLAFALSPWPSVLIIRAIFDKGAAEASQALERRVPEGLSVREGVRYDSGDRDAWLDVYRPARPLAGAPTVVWIHGGGFVSGRRGDIANYLKVLAGEGFTVVNVDYTIAPGAAYPTPIRQVARALAFIDRNGEALGVNRRAIVLAGDSAGAQIAAQTANLITSPDYARAVGVAAPIRPGQLKGALLFCGVYDVASLGRGKGGVLGWFLGTVTWAYSGKRDWRQARGFERMSVAAYVTSAFPPAFISAGNADPLLPQSLALDRALSAQGVPVERLFFQAGHKPPLSHEYQFDLDRPEGRLAFARAKAWLRAR